MKKSLPFLFAALLPTALFAGACGDDAYDAIESIDDADASRRDATPLPPPPDGSTRPDGGDAGDASDADAATDAAVDVDAGDGGEAPDPAIAAFVANFVTAACTKYSTCCAGDPNLPDPDPEPPIPAPVTCAMAATTEPQFYNGLLDAYFYNPQVAVRSRVRIDAVKAAACVEHINEVGCLDEGVPAATWKTLLQDCGSALSGIGVAGDECYSDLECATDFACNNAVRGGVAGTCTAVRELGQPYQNSGQYYGDSCSYRGFGITTGNRNQKTVAGVGGETCLPQQALNQPCVPFSVAGDYEGVDYDCASYACSLSDDFEQLICRDTKTDFLYCAQYLIP